MGMKSSLTILTALLAANMAMVQVNTTPTPASNQSGQAQGQSNPKPATSSNEQARATAAGNRVLQAKSQEELKAYQDASTKTNPAEMEVAADAFAAKYPNSEVRGALYIRARSLYGQENNSEKIVDMGRKAIAADPTNPVPL